MQIINSQPCIEQYSQSNLQTRVCGVCTKAFHEVSKRNNKIISKNTLVSNMDRQKVGISVDFFSEEVEKF